MELENRKRRLLDELPPNVRAGLLKTSHYSDNWEEIAKYFRESSIISKILMKDPASFKMLEIMYKEKMPESAFGRYVVASESVQVSRNGSGQNSLTGNP